VAVDVDAAVTALDALMVALDDATREGVADGAARVQRLGRTYVPETSGRGSGQLASSITVTGPYPSGLGSHTAKVGPTTVYGRIREIGGQIPGRRTVMTHPFLRWEANGRTFFARKVHQKGGKYMLRAVIDVRPQFQDICARRWRHAIESV
jgi:hypothetical protein